MIEPPSLFTMDFFEGFRVAKIFKGLKTAWGELPKNVDELSLNDRMDRLEKALRENPRDWWLLNTIGDLYIRSGQLCLALEVTKKAYEIRPFDIRSTFALASAYRAFLRAQFINIPKEQIIPREIFPDETTWQINLMAFDPEGANEELEKLGVTLDEVALKAMYYFEETLHLGVRKNEISFVNECLQKIYSEFPHLEIRANNLVRQKNQGKNPLGIEDSIFTDAIGHYTRLRFVLDSLPKYRYELGEVIRLCLWGVTAEKNNGDLLVLLANGYTLLDTCVQSSMTDHEYFERWAAAILIHWSENLKKANTTPENIIIGERLLADVEASMMYKHHADRNVIVPMIRVFSQEFLADALSPASFKNIKFMLESEPI